MPDAGYPRHTSDKRSKKFITPVTETFDAKKEIEYLDGKLNYFSKLHYDSASMGWSSSDEHPEGYRDGEQQDWNIDTGYVAQDINEITGSAHARKFVHRITEDEADVGFDKGLYRLDYKGVNALSTQALIDMETDVTDLETRVTALEGG